MGVVRIQQVSTCVMLQQQRRRGLYRCIEDDYNIHNMFMIVEKDDGRQKMCDAIGETQHSLFLCLKCIDDTMCH